MSSRTEARRSLILDEVMRSQIVEAQALAARFGVSSVTIRRDLEHLAGMGLLARLRGGARASSEGSLFQPYSTREHVRRQEKERIGQAAASLVVAGQQIITESGTTIVQVARGIPKRILEDGPLTVITSSLPIAIELGRHKGVHLNLLGGVYQATTMSVVGPQATRAIENIHADLMFVGCEGLTLSDGLTMSNMLEAEVVMKMLSRASRVIAVLDSSKIGKAGLTTIAPVSALDTVVTDSAAPAEFIEALRKAGPEVIVA